MSDQREGGISWTDETWNPIRGCRRVNPDCINCYAERLAATRLATSPKYLGLATMTEAGPRWTGKVTLDEADLVLPLSWKRPRLVFVNAMSDLFYEDLSDGEIDQVVAVMALAGQHTFQVLTKRPERMAKYLASRSKSIEWLEYEARELGYTFKLPTGGSVLPWPLKNVWWGASMGHQKAVDDLLPALLKCRANAAVLWVSAEPLTEVIDLEDGLIGARARKVVADHGGDPNKIPNGPLTPPAWIDWVVGGGETDRGTGKARPTSAQAARFLRDQVTRAGLPFHWKQWGEWLPHDQLTAAQRDLSIKQTIAGYGQNIYRFKSASLTGRLLDGKLWDEYPRGFTRAA